MNRALLCQYSQFSSWEVTKGLLVINAIVINPDKQRADPSGTAVNQAISALIKPHLRKIRKERSAWYKRCSNSLSEKEQEDL